MAKWINLERFAEGRIKGRKYRNRRIGELFKEIDLSEKKGTGIPKILRELKKNGSPGPEFDMDDDRTYLNTIIHIRDGFDKNEIMSESMSESMSELEIARIQVILQYLTVHDTINSAKAAELLDVEKKTASRLLSKAEKVEVLISKGKTKDKVYMKNNFGISDKILKMKIGDSMFEKIKQLMTGNLSKGGRQVYIDDLRVIATVFVIGVHTVSLAATMTEYGSIPFRVLTIFNFIFLSCNLLFVMLSGALLLPVKMNRSEFFPETFHKSCNSAGCLLHSVYRGKGRACLAETGPLDSDVEAYFNGGSNGGTSFLAGLCDHLAVCTDAVYAVYCT